MPRANNIAEGNHWENRRLKKTSRFDFSVTEGSSSCDGPSGHPVSVVPFPSSQQMRTYNVRMMVREREIGRKNKRVESLLFGLWPTGIFLFPFVQSESLFHHCGFIPTLLGHCEAPRANSRGLIL